ncbi:MAG: TetR/AcrR family transcriptional regulator [Pseudomonadota bacterium]
MSRAPATAHTAAAAAADSPAADTRRSQLLEEAARLFGAKGYEHTSMRDIAAAFGVLPGSLYHHYASKDALFVAVYAAGVAQILDAVDRAVASHSDPWDRLEAACVAHLQTLLQKQSYAAAVITDWSAAHLAVRDALVPHRDRYEQQFAALIDALPLRPEVDRRYFRLGLLGALNWSLTWFRPGREAPAAVARRLLAVFRPAAAAVPAPARNPA